jgi:hypothetical protein
VLDSEHMEGEEDAEWRTDNLRRKEMEKRTKESRAILYTAKSLPNYDVVQTEARLSRGHRRRSTLRGATGFSKRRRMLVKLADEVRTIRESSAVKIGARRGESCLLGGR